MFNDGTKFYAKLGIDDYFGFDVVVEYELENVYYDSYDVNVTCITIHDSQDSDIYFDATEIVARSGLLQAHWEDVRESAKDNIYALGGVHNWGRFSVSSYKDSSLGSVALDAVPRDDDLLDFLRISYRLLDKFSCSLRSMRDAINDN